MEFGELEFPLDLIIYTGVYKRCWIDKEAFVSPVKFIIANDVAIRNGYTCLGVLRSLVLTSEQAVSLFT